MTITTGVTAPAIVCAGGDDDYIEIDATALVCLFDVESCDNGITIGFFVSMQELEENTVIFSTGGEVETNYGFVCIYALGKFQLTVTSLTKVWHTSFDRFELNVFTRLDFSWHHEQGVAAYVNGFLAGRSDVAMPRATELSSPFGSTLYFCQPTDLESGYVYAKMTVQLFGFNMYHYATAEVLFAHGILPLCE